MNQISLESPKLSKIQGPEGETKMKESQNCVFKCIQFDQFWPRNEGSGPLMVLEGSGGPYTSICPMGLASHIRKWLADKKEF